MLKYLRQTLHMLQGAVIAETKLGFYFGEGLPILNFREPQMSLGYVTYWMRRISKDYEQIARRMNDSSPKN